MKTVVCLMGPTASGKTGIAVSLVKRFPFDIVSVDSALVYRGMDIGTAKPGPDILARAPHRLINIRDPEEAYSAGDFVRDARREIDDIVARGRLPLLVGGTMMYFRALAGGIAKLPAADARLRAEIDAEAGRLGWPALHARLARVDPAAAARINPHDSQRVQRALEVYEATGKPLSSWQNATPAAVADEFRIVRVALRPASRKLLHLRIERRLKIMLNNGFLEEVKVLYDRPCLTAGHASMRAVGYRQLWRHLAGETTLEEASQLALFATRQLAKRQITWLRGEPGVAFFDPLEVGVIDAISRSLIEFFDA